MITFDEIRDDEILGRIIEEYPQDQGGKSCLILRFDGNNKAISTSLAEGLSISVLAHFRMPKKGRQWRPFLPLLY